MRQFNIRPFWIGIGVLFVVIGVLLAFNYRAKLKYDATRNAVLPSVFTSTREIDASEKANWDNDIAKLDKDKGDESARMRLLAEIGYEQKLESVISFYRKAPEEFDLFSFRNSRRAKELLLWVISYEPSVDKVIYVARSDGRVVVAAIYFPGNLRKYYWVSNGTVYSAIRR